MGNSTQMSIHRALSELKVINDRIETAINQGNFVVATNLSDTKYENVTVEEYESKLQGQYDKVQSLILRRNKLKTAVVESNARTIVTIGKEEMTVAAAIDRKDSISLDKNFLRKLQGRRSVSIDTMNRANERAKQQLDPYLNAMFGDSSDKDSATMKEHTALYLERNTFGLIDPMDISKVIEELEERISNFEAEVDAVLSESNATTLITIEE